MQTVECRVRTWITESISDNDIITQKVPLQVRRCNFHKESIFNKMLLYFFFSVQDAEVVRLAGLDGAYRGRVEVYTGRAWSTICDDGWDVKDAQVICRMLHLSFVYLINFSFSIFRPDFIDVSFFQYQPSWVI